MLPTHICVTRPEWVNINQGFWDNCKSLLVILFNKHIWLGAYWPTAVCCRLRLLLFWMSCLAELNNCPASRTTLVATRFWVVMICPIIKCLTVLEFSFILFDLCLFITIFNFILNYVPIVTFWILTYHKIWILLIIFCFIWSYWIIYFLTCLEVFWSVVS